MCRYKLVQENSDSEDSEDEEYSPPPAKATKVHTSTTKERPKGVGPASTAKEEEDDPYGGSTDEEAKPQTIQKLGWCLYTPVHLCYSRDVNWSICSITVFPWSHTPICMYVCAVVRQFLIPVSQCTLHSMS